MVKSSINEIVLLLVAVTIFCVIFINYGEANCGFQGHKSKSGGGYNFQMFNPIDNKTYKFYNVPFNVIKPIDDAINGSIDHDQNYLLVFTSNGELKDEYKKYIKDAKKISMNNTQTPIAGSIYKLQDGDNLTDVLIAAYNLDYYLRNKDKIRYLIAEQNPSIANLNIIQIDFLLSIPNTGEVLNADLKNLKNKISIDKKLRIKHH